MNKKNSIWPKKNRETSLLTSVCLGDAMAGDGALFTREDAVEAAWSVVDPVLVNHPKCQSYEQGSWGPVAADALIETHGSWKNPDLNETPEWQRT